MINQMLVASILCLFSQVTIPADAKVAPGRLLKITATSDNKVIRWLNVNDDVDLIVSDNGKWAIFSSTVAGQYKIFCWTAAGDVPSEPVMCLVTVKDLNNPDVVPSKLLSLIQKAYEQDLSQDKKTEVKLLKIVYDRLLGLIDSEKMATHGDFYTFARKLSIETINQNCLQQIRQLISEDLSANISTDPSAELNAEAKQKLKILLLNYSKILGGL